jgi:hypothetical protein
MHAMTTTVMLKTAATALVASAIVVAITAARSPFVARAWSTPAITSVDPASPTPSSSPLRAIISGSDFRDGLVLEVLRPDGQAVVLKAGDIQDRRESAFAVSLTIDVEGVYNLKVTNTDGGVSDPFPLEARAVHDPKPDAPVITSVKPAEPVHRPEAQILSVDGQQFEPGLRAIITGPAGQEVPDVVLSKVTDTSFELLVRLDQAGQFELVVVNPAGAVSNVVTIPVR